MALPPIELYAAMILRAQGTASEADVRALVGLVLEYERRVSLLEARADALAKLAEETKDMLVEIRDALGCARR